MNARLYEEDPEEASFVISELEYQAHKAENRSGPEFAEKVWLVINPFAYRDEEKTKSRFVDVCDALIPKLYEYEREYLSDVIKSNDSNSMDFFIKFTLARQRS